MNSVILFIVIILCLTTNNYTDCLFASIGKSVFTSENNYDECGFTDVLKIKTISYSNRKCLLNNYTKNYTNYYPIIEKIGSNSLPPPQSRVSWGRQALWAEAPWAVHLLFRLPHGLGLTFQVCSGNLITLEWVLTAAHCFIDNPPSWETVVSAGDPNMNTPQVREGFLHIVHPNYRVNENDDRSYDIGLIKLLTPFTREIYRKRNRFQINPVCLPEQRFTPNEQREEATLYGFGIGKYVEENSLQRAHFTLEVSPEVQLTENNSNCYTDYLTLCARVSGHEPRICKGDSGAGLIQRDEKRNAYVVIGVLSAYFPEDENGINVMCFDESEEPYYQYFASVPRVVDWIIEQITNTNLTNY